MHDTKEKIVKAATDIFVDKGFSGASMSMIAKAASVNQSLIYHHFESKEELWQTVKEYLIVKDNFAYAKQEYNSLADFIDDVIEHRISLYSQDRRIVRFIQWQRLEDNRELVSGKSASSEEWVEVLKKLQKDGKVTDKYHYENIYTFILVLSTDYLDDSSHFFRSNKKREDEYLKMFKDIIVKEFSV